MSELATKVTHKGHVDDIIDDHDDYIYTMIMKIGTPREMSIT